MLRAFVRQLPGAGFVAIDVTPVTSLFRKPRYRGSLVVERRASWRRHGNVPPVIAQVVGKSIESVIQQLLPAAECNPAIGAALLRRQRVLG